MSDCGHKKFKPVHLRADLHWTKKKLRQIYMFCSLCMFWWKFNEVEEHLKSKHRSKILKHQRWFIRNNCVSEPQENSSVSASCDTYFQGNMLPSNYYGCFIWQCEETNFYLGKMSITSPTIIQAIYGNTHQQFENDRTNMSIIMANDLFKTIFDLWQQSLVFWSHNHQVNGWG